MSTYRLDKANAKLMGVCAGFANLTGVDIVIVRLSMVIATLLLGPVAILIYLLTGWIAN